MTFTMEHVGFADIQQAVTHHYTESNGVRLHYASLGRGPLVVLLHGFPDHWLGWWHQMAGLSARFQVVALDLRGYNLSGQPKAVEDYDSERLVADVNAVIEATGQVSAIVVGHDWGGYVAWQTAMQTPSRVRGLAVLSIPHPWAIARDLENNPAQRKASEYTIFFQQQGSHLKYPFERLGFWIDDPHYLEVHMAAMKVSNLEAMLHYYRANFPAPPYCKREDAPVPITVPTLLLHGRQDAYALPCGLNDVWNWIDADLEIGVFPDAGHFLHHEKRMQVTQRLLSWAARFH